MTGSTQAVEGSNAKSLNVDGDLLSGEEASWMVVDSDGDARLYVETGKTGIKPGSAYVKPNDGRVIEVGLVEERDRGRVPVEGVPLVDVEVDELVEFVPVDEMDCFEDVTTVELVS